MEFKKVSLIIPCRNEELFISKCLDSIISQDYPKEKMEILVVNGMSEDRTREIVEEYSKKYSDLKILENPKKITPAAMNIGIKAAGGAIIIKMDAHSTYEKDYVSKCVKYLQEWEKRGAYGVGGIIKTLPSENTLFAKAIAVCLSHPFGAGFSYFRIGTKKPRWVDTVAFGCYRKEIFDKIGPYNEKAERIEDIEFNSRIRKAGGRILLVPEIVAFYYPKSNLSDFFKHNFSDGFWITYPLKFRIRIFSLRHLIPVFFVSSLLITGLLGGFFPIVFRLFLFIISLYFLINVCFSAEVGASKKDFRYLFLMPIVFAIRHIGYGLGSIFGLLKLLVG